MKPEVVYKQYHQYSLVYKQYHQYSLEGCFERFNCFGGPVGSNKFMFIFYFGEIKVRNDCKVRNN